MDSSSVAMLRELLTCGTNIPLWHYDTEGHLLDTSSGFIVLDKILNYIGGIRYMTEYGRQNSNPLVLGGDMGLMWCAVFERDRNTLQGIHLLGPVFNSEISTGYIEESINRYHIDPSFQKKYVEILNQISVVPSVMFLQYALMLHYCVTGEKLDRSDIQFQPRNEIISPFSADSEQQYDNRAQLYRTELALLRILREGDMNYKQALADAHHLFGGFPANMKNQINFAVIRATGFASLCIREAITAGISPDTAYSVGESYIESMIQCRTIAELTSILLAMYEDFVYRSHKHRTNPQVSSQIQGCREYIELHAEEELKLPQLARHIGYSEYYLSRKFKKEIGVSISTYIRYVRIERSKLLLISTGMSISQIADSLHFASSSHFSESFREVTGKTPQQYRTEKN